LLEVTGNGNDSSYWRCDGLEFQPRQLYQFRTRARRTSGSGTAITGPTFANRDQQGLTGNWQWIGHVFRAPDNVGDGHLRVGQWHATGAIQFDEVQLRRAMAVHAVQSGLTLGEGEIIHDGEYSFLGSFSHEGSNHHRPLASATAGFNSDRWVFGNDQQVTYRFDLPGYKFVSGDVQFNVNYYVRGNCVAEVSGDRKTWHELVTKGELGTASARLPDSLLPAPRLWLRLRGSAASYFQVNQIDFRAKLSGSARDAVGRTYYAAIESAGEKISIDSMFLTSSWSGPQCVRVEVSNRAEKPAPWNIRVPRDGKEESSDDVTIGAGEFMVIEVDLVTKLSRAGQTRLSIVSNLNSKVEVTLNAPVPRYYGADYGQRISGVRGDPREDPYVWWCDATHKVSRQRAVPRAESAAARLEAARHDFEAVQLVVRSKTPLRGFTATATPLVGPIGSTIPAENIRILRVYYHFVHRPTDRTGVRDYWPDALPPLDQPIDVEAQQNQPLWVLLYVPPDAQPGDYRGTVKLTADGYSAEVPLELRVWDFTLPKRNHLETAYGLGVGDIFRYHQLKTEEDKRKVLDMYFQSFAEHRISVYDPTPLDPIGVKFLPKEEPPRTELDFARFDKAMAWAVEHFHSTGFRLPIRGMGGGTFHERYPPKIGEFGEDTSQYRAMFSSYVAQLETHLREKGWLDMAYVYWFDEPAPRDYEFVANGMRRLKDHAPGLRRMLTEEPGDNELAGLVDIWCPVSHHYNHDEAEKRRAHNERFWWYVCTGPKAPYCTLFIDHPATELRVWHWQTWQRNIVGTLVWRSNYWTSSAAFPDEPQNPYEDPMGYVSGYSTPRGVKRYWGNGDGRFIYPPLAAAVPGKSGSEPVIAPPVSSIRWEMIREGVEDYEYLYLLRELIRKNRDRLSEDELRRYEALLVVPPAITTDMTTFTTDPTPIYERRRAVAHAIEALGK